MDLESESIFKDVGIDSVGFYAPKFYLDLEDLAKIRNIEPKKLTAGLLLKEMRIPEPGEDIVTMSIKAAQNAMMRGNISASDIDAVFVGTETVTYSVKSVSNILVDILGVSRNSISQDIYNACAGATLALLNAISLVENGIIKKALVIGADISKYRLKSNEEPTQGAGAVAFIISKNPRIARFSHKFGRVSGNINDFFRPSDSEEAQVFGKYSVESYLKFQLDAYDDLFKNMGQFHADYFVFHAPFSKLPIKLLQKFIVERSEHFVNYIVQSDPKPPRSRITEKIPSIRYTAKHFPSLITKMMLKNGYSRKLITQILSKVGKLTDYFLPHLEVPAYFGNMYSASVWAQLIYILENFANENDVLYFGSYGSGATCISGLIKVVPTAHDILLKSPHINDYLERKVKISVKKYEALHNKTEVGNFSFGLIEEIKKPQFQGITLSYCDEGCLIPTHLGINHCPQGHSGFHTNYYPIFAKLVKLVTEEATLAQLSLSWGDYIRISGKPEPGTLIEFDMRRFHPKAESASGNGLLSWIPTYSPSSIPTSETNANHE